MAEQRLGEFRLAAMAVLDGDVIAASADRSTHTLVRRQAQHLNAWFGSRAGWRLDAHAEFVRLLKLPARAEPSLSAEWTQGARDYELFAWVLWFSEQLGKRRFRLSDMAAHIRDRSGTHGGAGFDWLRYDDRIRLRRVMEALERMGAVRLWDGSAHEWAQDEGKKNALYEWGALTWNFRMPYTSATLAALAAGTLDRVPPPEVVMAPPRMRLFRALLLTPACFKRDDPEAFAVLSEADEVRKIAADLLDHTGLELEVATSYARLLRSTTRSEAVIPPIPASGSEGQLITLLCGEIRMMQADEALTPLGDDWYAVPASMIELALGRIRDRHSDNWRKEFRTWSTRRLLGHVIPDMRRWGLMRGPDGNDTYEVSPLVARLDGYYSVVSSIGAQEGDE